MKSGQNLLKVFNCFKALHEMTKSRQQQEKFIPEMDLSLEWVRKRNLWLFDLRVITDSHSSGGKTSSWFLGEKRQRLGLQIPQKFRWDILKIKIGGGWDPRTEHARCHFRAWAQKELCGGGGSQVGGGMLGRRLEVDPNWAELSAAVYLAGEGLALCAR